MLGRARGRPAQRRSLRNIRTAIDQFKDWADTGKLAQSEVQFGNEGYPSSLEQLVDGALIANDSLSFVCKRVNVRVEEAGSSFTGVCSKGEVLSLPISPVHTPQEIDTVVAALAEIVGPRKGRAA